MADEERIYSKLEALETSIASHSKQSVAFQNEVMNILKGSFDNNEWRPGIAPLLQEQIVRIDALEAHVEKSTHHRHTWWQGAAFAMFGAVTSKLFSLWTVGR